MVSQKQLEEFAARLDRNQTKAERWLAKYLKPWCAKRDVLFHTQIAIHGYILDFYFPQFNLAVELDGCHHNEQRDRVRDGRLAAKGIRVMRFNNPKTRCDMNQIYWKVASELRYQHRRLFNRKSTANSQRTRTP